MKSLTRTLFSVVCVCLLLASCSDRSTPADGDVTPPASSPHVMPVPGYDLTWNETTRSPIALYESQGLAAHGLLYVFGGYYTDEIESTDHSYAFEPKTGQWLSLAPMPEEITHAGQALYRNKIYLAGGFVGDHPGPPTNHVWVYDIPSDSWAAGPDLPESLGGGALVELGGKLHFFGGTVREGNVYLQDSARHWVLDLTDPAPTWTEAAALLTPRNHLAGVSVGGKIYALGGQALDDEDYGNSQAVEAYDPELDTWEAVASLPRPLGHISAGTFSHNGKIFLVMGVTQGRVKVRDVLAYDPGKDIWGTLKPFPGGRSATVAGIIDGNIVLATGTVAGEPLDTTWIGTLEQQ